MHVAGNESSHHYGNLNQTLSTFSHSAIVFLSHPRTAPHSLFDLYPDGEVIYLQFTLTSWLDYANSFCSEFLRLTSTNCNWFRTHWHASYSVGPCGHSANTTQTIISLRWHPIKYRINFKIPCFTHGVITRQQSSYLNLLSHTSVCNLALLKQSSSLCATLFNFNHPSWFPSLCSWNLELRSAQSTSFWSQLKTLLLIVIIYIVRMTEYRYNVNKPFK